MEIFADAARQAAKESREQQGLSPALTDATTVARITALLKNGN